ncbi:hypothetical protein SAMN04488498_1665 [Mesorhizobium albiziae]|uniref:Uncharacterized protein n=2 Tax=Neomesorhizobium albiziae TaxID=335020 RepID=A0A1I4FZG8_9HYPH|nr:hypothetical protein [Mesorhizobium albiziae]GLS33032.1 hypothetical protein GCM10007937_47420 [Mesorhizobium albiziae]SFL22710.1 hypothetical protein SAMN04488498_1665 [Mesorhizobium albiziae]
MTFGTDSQTDYFQPTLIMTQGAEQTTPLYNFQEALDDETKLREVLRSMRDDLNEVDSLGEMIRRIEEGGGQNPDNVSRGLRGLGGIFGHSIVTAAKAKAPAGQFDPKLKVTIDSRGHIDGYFFDHQDKGGYLNVTTEVTIGLPNGTVDVDRSRYEVEIGDHVFNVILKDTTNSAHVFPGSDIQVSAAMAANFNYKLWAKGNQITVVRLWLDHDDDGVFEPNERVTTSNHGDWRDSYRHILLADVDSCIDMMFVHHPPETLPPGAAPPFYCLGRCEKPPLINTRG